MHSAYQLWSNPIIDEKWTQPHWQIGGETKDARGKPLDLLRTELKLLKQSTPSENI